MSNQRILIPLRELCEELELSREACVELVEQGIINPPGDEPERWTFDITMVSVVRRAVRLRQDLDLDWSTVALVVSLLEERDQLRTEIQVLQQRLDRFLEP
ncbi:MAG: chaperone modulatory protein CbpM [Proteobacteria bacterium]|nr:chaperone modulatory protein CbpM [Pseudomonadota bacterium]